jgi:hypothetical protein
LCPPQNLTYYYPDILRRVFIVNPPFGAATIIKVMHRFSCLCFCPPLYLPCLLIPSSVLSPPPVCPFPWDLQILRAVLPNDFNDRIEVIYDHKELLKYIDEDQLLVRYGGKNTYVAPLPSSSPESRKVTAPLPRKCLLSPPAL